MSPAAADPVGEWPPQFSATLLAQARALLAVRSLLVVIGPTGGSRNQLAGEIAGAPEGPVWFRHAARFGEGDLPYFALSQIFRSLEPQHDVRTDAVEDVVRAELAGLESGPPILVLANADRCDPESIEVLMHLAHTGDVRLIATLPAEAVPERQVLVGQAEIVDLPPLTSDNISELMGIRFGATPHPTLADLIAHRSDGAYAVVRDIADSADAEGLFVRIGDTLLLDPARAEEQAELLTSPAIAWTTELVDDGSSELADLVHLIAILGQVDQDDATSFVGPAVTNVAVSHGSIAVVDDALVFRSTAESIMVARSLTHERQITLLDRYARLVRRTITRPGVAVRAADWWRAGGRPLPPELAAQAAREANLSGQHRRALVFTDPEHVEGGARVALVERIHALIEIGDRFELNALYTSLDPAALSEEELFPYVRWVATLKNEVDRKALGERAVESDDPAVTRRRSAVRTLGTLVDRTTLGGGAALVSQLRALTFSDQLSPVNRAVAFTALSAALRHSALPSPAVQASEFALALLSDSEILPSAPHLTTARDYHVLALIAALDLDGAEQAIHDYTVGPFRHLGTGRMTVALDSLLHLIRGDSERAVVQARLCLESVRHHDARFMRGWLESLIALVQFSLDRTDDTRAMLAESKQHGTPRAHWDLERRIGQACVHDVLGEPDEALTILADVVAEAKQRELLAVHIEAAVLSFQIGGPPFLQPLLEAVGDLVEPSGQPAAWQRFAWSARDRDTDQLIGLADELDEQGARFFAAGVAQYVLDTHRRRGDLDDETRARLQTIRIHRPFRQ